MASANVLNLNDGNFDSEINKGAIPVLVDFWAPWCGPCRMIAPVLEELGSELNGKLKIAKVNVDENPELAGEFGIRSIPTLLVFKGGVVQQQMVGAMGKPALRAKLDPFMAD